MVKVDCLELDVMGSIPIHVEYYYILLYNKSKEDNKMVLPKV